MLTRSSPTPLYRQFKDQIVRDVEAGALAIHAPLPSERDWVKSLGVSRITVRQALSELVQLGYLYSVPGKGFFVADRGQQARDLDAFLSFTASAEARGETPSSRILGVKLVRASADEARALGIAPGAEVVSLRRLRLSNDVPMMVQESWLPHARCPGLLDRDLTRQSLFTLLREAYGLAFLRAESTITARLGEAAERKWLGLDPPGVVLVVDQITFATDGAPIERAVSIMHPDRHPLALVQHQHGKSLSAR